MGTVLHEDNPAFYAHLKKILPRDFEEIQSSEVVEHHQLLVILQDTAHHSEMALRKSISDILNRWRSENNYSYDQACGILGISSGHLSQWLNKPHERRASIVSMVKAMQKAGIR